MNCLNLNADEKLIILFEFLQKIEDILSLLNLPESLITKYNQYKEKVFQKMNIIYRPLISKENNTKTYYSNILVHRLNLQNIKELMLLDLIIEYVDDDFKGTRMKKYMEKINNINDQKIIQKSYETIEKDLSEQDQKLNKLIVQFEQLIRKNSTEEPKAKCPKDYEDKLKKIQTLYENEIFSLRQQLGISNNKNFSYSVNRPDFKNTTYSLNNNNSNINNNITYSLNNKKDLSNLQDLKDQKDQNDILLNTISQLIINHYNKYYPNNCVWYNEQKNDYDFSNSNNIYSHPFLQKLKFLLCLIDKLSNENNYLTNFISQLEKDKNNLAMNVNQPYISNAINNYGILKDLNNDVNYAVNSSDLFHKNYEELIKYITTNIDSNFK